jgi:hypothetical protein
MKRKCPVCENPVEIPDGGKAGARATCTNCFAQLAVFKNKIDYFLACAICKEPVFDPANCGDCERRRERKRLLEEGRL